MRSWKNTPGRRRPEWFRYRLFHPGFNAHWLLLLLDSGQHVTQSRARNALARSMSGVSIFGCCRSYLMTSRIVVDAFRGH